MGYLERFSALYGLLVAVGLIFGTFTQFQQGLPFDFAWFTNLLFFAIGFPVLILISILVFAIGIRGEEEVLSVGKKKAE